MELCYRDGVTEFRIILAACFSVFALASVLLYGVSVYDEALRHGGGGITQKILVPSLVLAGVVLIVGTLVELMLERVERQLWRLPSGSSQG